MTVPAVTIGFLPFGWTDAIDVGIVAFLVYQVYRLIRGTIAVQISLVLLGIFAMDAVVRALGMTTLQMLFGAISDVFVIAVIILFAPEIRRLLFMLGRNPLVRRFVPAAGRTQLTDELAAAVQTMSEKRIGSLIVLGRATGLRNYVETGTPLQAQVTRDLLTSIFFPNSPLHDGAVIIQGAKIEAARCILPVSEGQQLESHLGLRHRAALGLAERSDAFIVVTSEETGRISVAENGVLTSLPNAAALRDRLNAAFSSASA